MKNENKSGGRKREGKTAVWGLKALTPGGPGRPHVGLDGGQAPFLGPCGPLRVAWQEEVASPFPPVRPAGGGRCLGSSQARLGGSVARTSAPLPPLELLPQRTELMAWGSRPGAPRSRTCSVRRPRRPSSVISGSDLREAHGGASALWKASSSAGGANTPLVQFKNFFLFGQSMLCAGA